MKNSFKRLSVYLLILVSTCSAEHSYRFFNNLKKPIKITGQTSHIGSEGEKFTINTIFPGLNKSAFNFERPEFKNAIHPVDVPWWIGVGSFQVLDATTNEVLCAFDYEQQPDFISGKGLGAGVPLSGRLGSMDFYIEKSPVERFILDLEGLDQEDKDAILAEFLAEVPKCKIRVYPNKERNTLGIRTCVAFDRRGNRLGDYSVFAVDHPGSCSCDEEGNPYSKCYESKNEILWNLIKDITKLGKDVAPVIKEIAPAIKDAINPGKTDQEKTVVEKARVKALQKKKQRGTQQKPAKPSSRTLPDVYSMDLGDVEEANNFYADIVDLNE